MGNFDVHVLYTRSQYPQFEPHVTRRSTAVASSHLQRYTHAPTTTTTTRQQQQSFLICDPRVFVVSPRSPSVRSRFPPVLDLGARLHLLCPRCLHLVCTSTSAVHVYSPVSSSNTIPSHTVEPVGLRSHRGQPTSSHTVEPVGLRSHRGQPTSVDREVSQPDAGTSSCTSTPAMAISAALRNTLNQGRPPTRPYSCHWRWHE